MTNHRPAFTAPRDGTNMSTEGIGRTITKTKEIVAYQNEFVTVYDDEVTFPDDSPGNYLRIVESEGRPGVAALALCRQSIALVRTYRYPISAWEWAIPRGFAHGNDPEQSILMELEEELGAAPESVEKLIDVTPNSGLLAGTVHMFVARYSHPAAAPRDVREVSAVRWETPRSIVNEFLGRGLSDAFTLSALCAAAMKGIISFESP